MRERLPDFLIVGAGKSGTTSLANYLSEHPEVFIPDVKELHFFAFANEPPNFSTPHILGPVVITTLSEYLNFFSSAPINAVLGEASVSYLYQGLYKKVISNIKKYHPRWKEIRIIIILREPVERAFSQYVTRLNDLERLPFKEAVWAWQEREKKGWTIAYDYLGLSFYYEPVKAYIDTFDHVKVYLYEDLKERPLWLVKDIFKFLEVDSNFIPQNLGKKYNVSFTKKSDLHHMLYKLYCTGIKYNPLKPVMKRISEETKEKIHMWIKKQLFAKPQLDKEVRESLKEVFREDILKLQDLIKRDLSHWLR